MRVWHLLLFSICLQGLFLVPFVPSSVAPWLLAVLIATLVMLMLKALKEGRKLGANHPG